MKLWLGVGAVVTASLITLGAQSSGLVQQANLRYDGAFRVPGGAIGGSTFDTGAAGRALTYYPAHNSLLVVGDLDEQMVAEITIPTPAKSSSPGGLPVAQVTQPFLDILEGKREQISTDANGDRIGGMLPSGGNLIVSAFGFYDNTNTNVSHFTTSLNFSTTGDVKGPYQVGTAGGGVVGGYMANLPADWQSALGGVALTGQCCLAINSRTSSGPAASVFNPSDVGSVSPVPAKQVLGYPLEHVPGASVFVNSDEVRGLAVPAGSASALFIGRHGLGPGCYGDGSACGDPADSSKGYHAYPYAYQIWAYDLHDLQAVKNGQKQPWEPRPYATWTLDLPYANSAHMIEGAAFDQATSRLFIAAAWGDGSRPVIHVFTVTGTGTGTAGTPPGAPTNVRVITN